MSNNNQLKELESQLHAAQNKLYEAQGESLDSNDATCKHSQEIHEIKLMMKDLGAFQVKFFKVVSSDGFCKYHAEYSTFDVDKLYSDSRFEGVTFEIKEINRSAIPANHKIYTSSLSHEDAMLINSKPSPLPLPIVFDNDGAFQLPSCPEFNVVISITTVLFVLTLFR